MNKLRSDSAFCQLTPEQTETLEVWLFEERLGYSQVLEMLKSEFGFETSLTGIRRFYKRLEMERSRASLMDAVEILKGVEGISFVQFDDKDVVRHCLVQRIVKAYERYNETIGAGRQLSLKLTEPAAENGNGDAKPEAVASPADTAPQA